VAALRALTFIPEAGGAGTEMNDTTPDVDSGAAETVVPPLKIFINYRHEDIPFAALTLYRELKGRFGAGNIFFDGGTLRPGMQFLDEIRSHLTGPAGAFIAVIGPKWSQAMTARRQMSEDDTGDYVLQEIELGLRNKWAFIPVLVNDATLPDSRSLPRAIRALREYQVAHVRETSLDDDIDELITRLDELSTRLATATSPDGDAGLASEPPEPPEDPVVARIAAREIRSADDEHYQTLVDEADNLVIFLGARANADDPDRPFRAGTAGLPDDTDIADYLAVKARMKSGERELAEVAQYARMVRGEPRVFRWVKQMLSVDAEPEPVHTYLARLPRRLEELGLERRYQMIVTPKLDVALERAFKREGEPFDVAVYMAPGTEHAGRFVHLPWGSAEPRLITMPNEYDGFPITGYGGDLTRTVIVRINGAIEDHDTGYRWKNNFVITEDHYIEFLGGRTPEEVVPMQILAKLRQSSCLFLGYAIADWRLRVFLHWIWPGERPSGATHWAVERQPSMLERQTWQRSGVGLYQNSLTEYVRGFDRFLTEHRDELI
jgi:hypothetical protein